MDLPLCGIMHAPDQGCSEVTQASRHRSLTCLDHGIQEGLTDDRSVLRGQGMTHHVLSGAIHEIYHHVSHQPVGYP